MVRIESYCYEIRRFGVIAYSKGSRMEDLFNIERMKCSLGQTRLLPPLDGQPSSAADKT